uniref:Uncharacterized protein n=1 Tax=Arcella intermedia TaxID=1963864 RepID=A0A6B2L380_9EUKA
MASLIDPKPEADPEEPHWDTGEIDYNKDVEQDPISNNARFMEAPTKKRLLPDIVMGPQYRGKKITRQELKVEVPKEQEEPSGGEEESEEPSGEEQDNVMKINLEESSSDDFEESEEDPDDGGLALMKSDQARDRQLEADRLEEEAEGDGEGAGPAVANVESQRAKAQHLLNQKVLWDSLLDVRISLQGLLDVGNRLPRPGDWGFYEGKEEVKRGMEEAAAAAQGLLRELGGLQQKMVEKDPFVRIDKVAKDMEEYYNWDFIQETQKMIEEASKPILDTWQTKVLLQSVNNKNIKLKSINQSIISQVDSTLSGHNLDNQLLRSRTVPDHLKRTIGHMEDKQTQQEDEEEDQRNKKTIAKTIYNPEIYNDEDFYATILNDRIQSRGQILTDTTDPIMMSQQFLRLRQLRRRKKKKDHVDQRASKGRKLRYQPHEKLINFMTPIITKYPKHDSLMTQLLYKSLFGSVTKSTK